MPEQVKTLNEYELVLLYKPDLSEEQLSASVDKVNQFITSRNGELIAANQWGKKRMAHPIEGFVDAYYVLIQLKLVSGTTKELQANLNLSEELMRYLLVRSEVKPERT